MKKISVLYNIHHYYYLPQFEPVIREMINSNRFDITFSAFTGKGYNDAKYILDYVKKFNGEVIHARHESERRRKILESDFDITIFGKSSHIEKYCSPNTLAVLLYHGIGVKSCYYLDYNPRIDVRYIEGEYRLKELQRQQVRTDLIVTGFPKMDGLYFPPEKKALIESLQIDSSSPTIIYAPTFYPSSVEIFGEKLGELSKGFNLLIKLHHFSWIMSKYRHQLELIRHLAYSNPHIRLLPLTEINIIPYYKVADLLLTEASSTAFEFLAIGKPSIVCNFFHLRHKHKLFNKRFTKSRMDYEFKKQLDFAYQLKAPDELPEVARIALSETSDYHKRTASTAEYYLGKVDGNAAKRVVEDLVMRIEKR